MSHQCPACKDAVKYWNGSDPKCGFVNKSFSSDNFMCQTAITLRVLCKFYVLSGIHKIPLIDSDDEYIYSISLTQIEHFFDAEHYPMVMLISWYKVRGRIRDITIISECAPPRPATEEECFRVLEHYSKNLTNEFDQIVDFVSKYSETYSQPV